MITRRIIVPLIGAALMAPRYVIGGLAPANTAGDDPGGDIRITTTGATRVTTTGATRITA